MIYRLRVLRDLPDLDLRAGDTIVYDPSDAAEPYMLARAITPDPGAILNYFVSGELDAIDITPASFARARDQISAPRVLQFPSAG